MKWGRNAILKREVQSNFCSVVVMYFSFLNCQGPKDEKIWITKSCYLKAGMHIRFHISFSYSRLFERCYSSTLAFGRTPFPCAYWKPLYEEEWRTPSIHRCYSNNNKSSPKNRQWQMASNFFFHPLLRDRKWSLWNRNDKRWNSFLLSSIGVKSWPPYLDNRAGAKLRRMDISCVSDTDKWPPSRYTFTILWMGWLSKLSRAFIHTHRETQKTRNEEKSNDKRYSK